MRMTLSEILVTCDDWKAFCRDQGVDPYAIAEGGGHIERHLTLDEAEEHGIVDVSTERIPSESDPHSV